MRPRSLLSCFIATWVFFGAMAAAAPTAARVADMTSALMIGALALRDARRPAEWSRWGLVLCGVWLLLQPLVFRAPASMYALDQLAGTLIILLAATRPAHFSGDSESPPGWSYNPSSWSNRVPVVGLAFAGVLAARAMSSYQMGHIGSIWDPFFGDGTVTVLTSDIARAFPVSDAGLGAVAYLLEGMSGVVGDQRRWKSMPWMVFLFFVLVAPAGVVSIVLVMLQPVAVGAWCALCLFTAAVTLLSIPPAVDEIFASYQYLARVRRAKRSVWRAFWGVDGEEVVAGEPSGDAGGLLSGISFPWPLALSTAAGLAVIVVSLVIDRPDVASDVGVVTGALLVTFAVIATAEPTRSLRFLNIPLGLWVVVAPFVFGLPPLMTAAHVVLGLIAAGGSVPRGAIHERYGGWERYIV